jgi:lon-related putative ATP-dependent protease
MTTPEEVPAAKLRNVCDAAGLGFTTTADVPGLETIVGQQRAVQALDFGLGVRNVGFNVYVAGQPGTGKVTAVHTFLEGVAKDEAPPSDWCYVHNFVDPYRPRALRLAAGVGRGLQQDMKSFIQRARKEIPAAFESDQYSVGRDAIGEALQRQREALLAQLNKRAQEEGFTIQATPSGWIVLPIMEGRTLSEQEFLSLDAAVREPIRQRREALETELKRSLKEARTWEKEANRRLQILNREVALNVVGGLVEDLEEKYQELPEVMDYLKQVLEDIVSNIDPFLGQPHQPETPGAPSPSWEHDSAFRKYEVNVVVDHSETVGAPVVMERNPTYNNLFGRIEKEALYGALQTDFTLIRGGSLHQANGGYLVLPVEEVLRNLFSYDSLKRAIRDRQIVVEDMGERLGYLTTKSLRPEPIPLSVKIVLIGPPHLYYTLYALDEDFRELFKVKAEFDVRMDRSEENVRNYVAFVSALCSREGLRPLDAGAVAKIVEYGSRAVEDQQKLTTRFSEVADIVRAANFWAERDGSPQVVETHVRKAIDEKVYRSNLIQERIQEFIQRGILLVDTAGEAVGQVNGLAVIELGDHAFGRPSRITASIGLGQAGLVDIEREARLGGPIHTKGVLILSGYLSRRYAYDKPLSLSARLVFEQSYEGVEGDSASCAELFTLLSALSGAPIKQGIAVTGSLNQQGEVQAIGGVNQKIEGFFDVCHAAGLTGEQGVIIPESNVQNLMLREDVVEAAEQGRFHVYPIRSVDQGIEILTGRTAGERGPDGTFPEGTLNHLVDQRLREMAERLRSFARDSGPTASGQAEEEEAKGK